MTRLAIDYIEASRIGKEKNYLSTLCRPPPQTGSALARTERPLPELSSAFRIRFAGSLVFALLQIRDLWSEAARDPARAERKTVMSSRCRIGQVRVSASAVKETRVRCCRRPNETPRHAPARPAVVISHECVNIHRGPPTSIAKGGLSQRISLRVIQPRPKGPTS